MRTAMMLGRLTCGAQKDHGKLVHIVAHRHVKPRPCPYNDWGRNEERMKELTYTEVSLCGKRPGKRSVGWSQSTEGPPTCEKCIVKGEKQGARWCSEHEIIEEA